MREKLSGKLHIIENSSTGPEREVMKIDEMVLKWIAAIIRI